ncbi:MAG: GAF domain-containing protein [Anaerolineales bacterium]
MVKNASPLPLQPLPTGEIRLPVCIGDLPCSDYSVPADTPTFDVANFMRDNEDIPGVMLFDGDDLVGVIPRLRMFERLGQLYGVDLFMRKPIRILQENLGTDVYELYDYLRVNEAVQSALARPRHTVYDPVILVSEDGKKRLLDMHTLLSVQSQIVMRSKNAVSSLDRVTRALSKRHRLLESLSDAIITLRESVPYHGAAVYLHRDHILQMVVGSGTSESLHRSESDGRIINSATYNMMIRLRHHVAIDDVDKVPDWEYMSDLGPMRCWLGIPLFSGHKFFGLVSINRLSRTPFNKEEVEIAQAFSEPISKALEEEHILTENNQASPNFKVEVASGNTRSNLIL